MADFFKRCAMQVSNACTCACACAYCAAECGKYADRSFFVDGYEVCKCKSTVKFFFGYFKFLCVNNNRNGSGHALVAAAGADYNRHFAAVHAGVAACCCHSACAGAYVRVFAGHF